MKERGLSREDLADQIGCHPITISKLITGTQRLSDIWIEKIAGALNVTPGALFDETPNIRLVPVRMHVQAGHWSESNEWPPDDQYMVPVPDDADLRGITLFAAETRGPSMNRRWPEGTVIVFTAGIETEDDVIIGKRYIVEWERADGLREATVKTLWRDDDGKFWLLPESDDPRHQAPIALNGNEGDTIRLVGRVVWAASRE